MKNLESTVLLTILLCFQVSCNSVKQGCTDPLASNFDPSATEDDSSCIYDPVYISSEWSKELDEQISETSGLILWDGFLWTFNDNTDTRLYFIDTATAEIIGDYNLPGVVNQDWEDIAQDQNFIYLGDFGNNSGNRTNLHIIRIDKLSLKSGGPSIDTIWFTFSDQHDFVSSGINQTEFDCEAFVASSDSIFLFTKQWLSGNTTQYALSKLPGSYVAQKRETFDIQGLVTGADYIEEERILVLCGYSVLMQPFLYLLYDFQESAFFSGNKKRFYLNLPFHQVEGIALGDESKYYFSNEASNLPVEGAFPQKLHLFNLD